MKLNHANLCTRDVAALSAILTRHFAFQVEEASTDYAVMHGNDGFFMVLTKIADDMPKAYPTGFHVGFVVETADAVVAKHDELSAAGCRPGPIKRFEALGAAWTAFYCPVGDGIEIEVTAREPA